MSQAAYEFPHDERSSSEDGPVNEQVKDTAQEVMSRVQETASSASERVGDRLSRLVQERSSQTGEQAIRMAESIRQSVGSMREQGQDGPARIAEQAADRVQAVGLYLRDNDGDRILRDVEDFARRQPLVVGAAAFALGVLGARFLKASAARRPEPRATTEPTFGDRPSTPLATPIDAELGTRAGVGGPPDMGIGAVEEVAPPPLDPAPDLPTDFWGPTTPGIADDPVAPPTTTNQ